MCLIAPKVFADWTHTLAKKNHYSLECMELFICTTTVSHELIWVELVLNIAEITSSGLRIIIIFVTCIKILVYLNFCYYRYVAVIVCCYCGIWLQCSSLLAQGPLQKIQSMKIVKQESWRGGVSIKWRFLWPGSSPEPKLLDDVTGLLLGYHFHTCRQLAIIDWITV